MMARRLRRLRRRWRHRWNEYVRWPAPLWRATGEAQLTLEGHAFKFCADDSTIWWLMKAWRGKGERNALSFMARALRPGDVFFDIGAWAGPYTLLAARLVRPGGGWVYAFEPDPVARNLLERNIAANALSNITVLPYAVTDTAGHAWLGSQALGQSQSFVNSAQGVVEIDTVSLDGFCHQHGVTPAIVKIDVEGAEAKVLAGGGKVLRRTRAVLLEIHEPQLRASGVDPDVFRQSVDALGKRLTVLHERGKAGVTNVALEEDAVFTPGAAPCA
jgi:FkbM family methyltransferase